MLKTVVLLLVCSTQSPDCQVFAVAPDHNECRLEVGRLIQELGPPPENVSVSCVEYERKE
jgi:hypothetical protein